MTYYHARAKTIEASTDSRAAYLSNEDFSSRVLCQEEIDRLGLHDSFEVVKGSVVDSPSEAVFGAAPEPEPEYTPQETVPLSPHIRKKMFGRKGAPQRAGEKGK